MQNISSWGTLFTKKGAEVYEGNFSGTIKRLLKVFEQMWYFTIIWMSGMVKSNNFKQLNPCFFSLLFPPSSPQTTNTTLCFACLYCCLCVWVFCWVERRSAQFVAPQMLHACGECQGCRMDCGWGGISQT